MARTTRNKAAGSQPLCHQGRLPVAADPVAADPAPATPAPAISALPSASGVRSALRVVVAHSKSLQHVLQAATWVARLYSTAAAGVAPGQPLCQRRDVAECLWH